MKKVAGLAVLAIFFLASAVGLTFLLAPFLIDAYILPRLLESITSIDTSASVARITPFSTSGTLSMDDGETPVASVPRFELRYTPLAIYKKRLSSLTIDNAIIHLNKDKSGFRLAGLSADPVDRRGAASPRPVPRFFPAAVETMIFRQCSLIIHEQEQADIRFSLSSVLHLRFTDKTPSGFALLSAEGSFLFFDALAAAGKVSLISETGGHKLFVHLQTKLNQLPERFVKRQHLLSGSLLADITASLDTESLHLENLEAAGTVKNFQVRNEKTTIRGGGTDSTLSFTLSGSPDHLDYQIGSLSITNPVPLDAEINGSGSYTGNLLQLKGMIQNRVMLPTDQQSPRISVPIHYELELDARSLDWQARLSGKHRSPTPPALGRDDVAMSVPDFDLNSSLAGTAKGLAASVEFAARPFSITGKQTKLDVSEISLAAQLERSDELTAVHISGSIAAMDVLSSGMKVADITFDLPYHFPFSPQHEQRSGRVTVGPVTFRDSPLFEVTAELSQQQGSLQLSGELKSLFSDNMHLLLEGAVEEKPLQAHLGWKLDKTALNADSVPSALRTFEGLDFDGFLAGSGKLLYRKGQISGSTQLHVDLDTLGIPGKNISIKTLSCGVTFPSLPAPFSLPSQHCSAAELVFGNLQFSDANVNFRVEDLDTVFIEKSSIKWCQGKLESTSLRLSRNNPEINTALYCSRINFSDLLNQFGLDQAQGQGSLNGKLPIALSREGLSFDEGFLFSTPGTGGIIRFSNTDMLRQGVGSADVGGYLDYSMKAMEDFAYQWTKLSFNSSGDELQLTMELNGKPRTPLPYGLKNGVIIKTDKGEGLQYPIQLDVNFRLPLAELFQIGQNIQAIKENM